MSQSDQPGSTKVPGSTEARIATSLPSAALLACTGGGIDAFVYLNHGHVFAAAMTGNLRTAMDGLYDALTPATRSQGLKKFRELSLIVASFLGGAPAGAILSPHLLNHTLWAIDLPMLAVLLLVLRRGVGETAKTRTNVRFAGGES